MRTLNNITLALDAVDDLRAVAARELGVSVSEVRDVQLLRRSIDARGRRPKWVVNLQVALVSDEPEVLEPDVGVTTKVPVTHSGKKCIIVGAGPAGLFAALSFADAGVPCVLIDRGAAISDRHKKAKKLRAERVLDPETNMCFGEGGAGAYSDGKLYTRNRNPRVREVYQRLVEFGADPNILIDAHPHVGTNRLIPVIENMSRYLREHGVTFRFNTRLDDLVIDNGQLRAIVCGNDEMVADAVILATGHSARDTYVMLEQRSVTMVPKAFAVGARVEHPQALIDQIQFGASAGHPALGAAEYFLKCQRNQRGVYSFCMCPGGFIIPTPTEPGHLNVNGMSNQARKNRFGNAALVVTVQPEDVSSEGNPLEGLSFQRQIERAAFEAGGKSYTAPATRLTDFVRGRASANLPERTSYRPSLKPSDIRQVLPDFVTEAIRSAVQVFDRRLRGYLTEEAVIVAAETTTSSPIRILRGDDLQSVSVLGLYPTGEGAGYAGGIVSSAIDGMRVAERILSSS